MISPTTTMNMEEVTVCSLIFLAEHHMAKLMVLSADHAIIRRTLCVHSMDLINLVLQGIVMSMVIAQPLPFALRDIIRVLNFQKRVRRMLIASYVHLVGMETKVVNCQANAPGFVLKVAIALLVQFLIVNSAVRICLVLIVLREVGFQFKQVLVSAQFPTRMRCGTKISS
jgi:hypothetical protein